MLRLR